MAHLNFASWLCDPLLRKVFRLFWHRWLHKSTMEMLQIADHNDIIFTCLTTFTNPRSCSPKPLNHFYKQEPRYGWFIIRQASRKLQAGSMAGKAAFVDIGLPGFEMPKYPNRIIIAELFNWVFLSCHHFFHEGGKDCLMHPFKYPFFFCGPSTWFQVMAFPWGASRWHSDTSHPIGLLWTSDQPNATTQHNTLPRDNNLLPLRDSAHKPS